MGGGGRDVGTKILKLGIRNGCARLYFFVECALRYALCVL